MKLEINDDDYTLIIARLNDGVTELARKITEANRQDSRRNIGGQPPSKEDVRAMFMELKQTERLIEKLRGQRE
jgi:hypothetical protein